MADHILVNGPNKECKVYWIKTNQQNQFINFVQDGIRVNGEHIVELNPATGQVEPVDGVLRWLGRQPGAPHAVEFYTGGTTGLLDMFVVVADAGGPDWTLIPRINDFISVTPPTQLEFTKRVLAIPQP